MPLAPSGVAITGASGFVGRAVVARLAGHGWSVRPVSVSSLVAAGLPPDAATLRSAFSGMTAVVHLAARVHQMDRPVDARQVYYAANVDLTGAVVTAAAAAGVPTVVLASSVKAVGECSSAPWNEETPPHPLDPYGESKLAAERLLQERGRTLGLRTVVLRFPLVYGPGVRANMLRLFRAVSRSLPLPFGAVTNQRSLLYVENAAAAIEAALLRSDAGSGLYFVRDGHDLSTPELVRAIAVALGVPARLLAVPLGLFRWAGRAGDGLARIGPWPWTSAVVTRLLGSLQVDDSLIRSRLQYLPPFPTEEGLARTAAWFRSAPAAAR